MASGFSPPCEGKISTPTWRARISSCSIAAGRYTSQETSRGLFPRPSFSSFASFAAVVVFPDPCSPARSTTAGGATARSSSAFSPPMSAASSRWTTPTSACPGVRLPTTSCPSDASRTRSMKVLTTGNATSASSSATRTSRSASWMFVSVRRASPRIVFTTRASRWVRLWSTSRGELRRRPGVHFADAGDSTLRRGVSALRGARVSFLAHALARRGRGEIRALGARGDRRAARAAYLAGLRHAAHLLGAALRVRSGAVDDAVARRDLLLAREPLPRGRGHAGAGARARGRVRPAAGALSRPGLAPVDGDAFDRIPTAPRARDERLRPVHHRGASRASHDPDGAAPARRGAGRAARGAPAAAHHGAAALPRDSRGVRVPDADADHRDRVLGNALRPRNVFRPQDGFRGRLVVHFHRAPRRPLFLRLARPARAALDTRRIRRTAARLRRQPFRARSDTTARFRLTWTTSPYSRCSDPSSSFWSFRRFLR